MSHENEIIDLDFDSSLENVFSFLGSPIYMGITFVLTWLFFISPGKNHQPPIWADFPVFQFFLLMLCIWAVGFYLKANYDIRYQLNSKTQQLDLVRKIFSLTYKSHIANFAQLKTVAIQSTWLDGKFGRKWLYALCLVTDQAKIIKVSSYTEEPPEAQADDIARSLGITNFPCQKEVGNLQVSRPQSGQIILHYQPVPTTVQSISNSKVIWIILSLSIITGVIYLFFLKLVHP